MNKYAIKSFEMGSKIEKSYAYYDLQFKHLPNLFSIYKKRETFFKSLNNGDNFLYNITAIKITFYLRYNYSSEYINWEEFHFHKKNLASDVVEYIYDFGVPKSYLLCRYAIYYVDPINRIYEYFTLEKTKNDKIDTYIICGKKNKRHKNYSKECEDNFETFERMVQDIIETQFKNYKESDL